MDSSSHIKRENTGSTPDQASLPEGYGNTEAVLLPRDPHWLFIYWEITEKTKDGIRRKHGAEIFKKSRQAIRVYEVTDTAATTTGEEKHFDIPVLVEATSWYINVLESSRTYCCEVGLLTPEGGFISLVRTNAAQLPAGRVSDAADDQWMAVTPDFNKLLQLAGVDYIGKGSGEVARSLAQRWETLRSVFSSAAAWGVSSLAPQAREISGRQKRKFWLVADCELILYGATEPGALITVSGRKVNLNPDGTFSMRFALPDGKIDLPVKAISKNGTDTRELEILVSRDTAHDKQ